MDKLPVIWWGDTVSEFTCAVEFALCGQYDFQLPVIWGEDTVRGFALHGQYDGQPPVIYLGNTVIGLTCLWSSPNKVRPWVGLPVCGALPTRWDCEWAHLSVELSQQGETVSGFACLWSSPNKVRLWVGSPVSGTLPKRWDCEWAYLSVELPTKVRLWVGLPVCGALPPRWDCEWAHLCSNFHCIESMMNSCLLYNVETLWIGLPVCGFCFSGSQYHEWLLFVIQWGDTVSGFTCPVEFA